MKTSVKENELEKIAEKFNGNFDVILIEGNSVYGYSGNSKRYLGTKNEYYKYRKLKSKCNLKYKKSVIEQEKEKAYNSFKESYRNRRT